MPLRIQSHSTGSGSGFSLNDPIRNRICIRTGQTFFHLCLWYDKNSLRVLYHYGTYRSDSRGYTDKCLHWPYIQVRQYTLHWQVPTLTTHTGQTVDATLTTYTGQTVYATLTCAYTDYTYRSDSIRYTDKCLHWLHIQVRQYTLHWQVPTPTT